jgi:hypothetical protein
MRVLDAGSSAVEIADGGHGRRIGKSLQFTLNHEHMPEIDREPDGGNQDNRRKGNH